MHIPCAPTLVYRLLLAPSQKVDLTALVRAVRIPRNDWFGEFDDDSDVLVRFDHLYAH